MLTFEMGFHNMWNEICFSNKNNNSISGVWGSFYDGHRNICLKHKQHLVSNKGMLITSLGCFPHFMILLETTKKKTSV